ncbi:MAG: hypothetical protein HQL41_11585 [Alphaproteobacteria bacterium]|nr:hypothetical protein [Alphaproteobacteria bacterium]
MIANSTSGNLTTSHPKAQPPGHRIVKRHAHPHKRFPWGRLIAAVLGGVAIGAAALWLLASMNGPAGKPEPSPEALLKQMREAAAGGVESPHIFGGALRFDPNEGVVVAELVPQKACVQAGWSLVRGGVLTVNGVTPQRVSAALLADLCSRNPAGATLEWAAR